LVSMQDCLQIPFDLCFTLHLRSVNVSDRF
jgi:hypothetical protein